MSMHHDEHRQGNTQGNFLTSQAWLVLIGFLMIAGFLLSTEHRGPLLGIAFWLLPFAFLLMQFVMPGGNGGDDGDNGSN